MNPSHRMTTKDMIKTIDSSRFMRHFHEHPEEKKQEREPVDWVQRNILKTHIFKKAILWLFAIVLFSAVFIILPIWIVKPSVGKAFLLSVPPMLFICFTWMVPSWRFFDKKALLLPMTVGMVPLRIIAILLFSYMAIHNIPEVPIVPLFVGMMFHWALFSIPEIGMMHQFASKLPRTQEQDHR